MSALLARLDTCLPVAVQPPFASFHGFFFDSLAKFLLAIGITDHDLFRPVHEIAANGAEEGLALLQAREDARRLILPDGIGEDLRVLVQEKGMGAKKWSFEQRLF
mgnify:CR=1 FL=1